MMSGHKAVLLNESINGLAIRPDGIYVDGTFGRGGHSRAILEQLSGLGRLILIDKDIAAIAYAKEIFGKDSRVTIVHNSFANLYDILTKIGIYGEVNGILLDLGVSSPQLDDPTRGFSFMESGPLDMRMNQDQTGNAADFINQAQEEEIALVFSQYGEERYARRIARAIVTARTKEAILTTNALAEIVKAANPKWEKHKHPATRVFQALRIFVNQELNDLEKFLEQCLDALTIGGRLVVISFHSLEDRIVKKFMRKAELGEYLPIEVPIKHAECKTTFRRIGKAKKPQSAELQHNIRARSAILRIGEKIA